MEDEQQINNDLEQELPSSKIQSYISELFRLQLCRNDDHNLAQSTVLKTLHSDQRGTSQGNAKALQLNKAKLIGDMKEREDDRITREKAILKDISGNVNQTNMIGNESLKKFIFKFVRKMLTLTVVDPHLTKQVKKQFLVQRYPPNLHLAQIMEERHDKEKDTFGKVILSDLGKKDTGNDAAAASPALFEANNFSDEQITNLTNVYINGLREPVDLLKQCVLRSRDRYNREYAKMHAYQVQKKFFTDEGLKDRSQTIKYKFFMKERFPHCKTDADLKALSEFDRAFGMLIMHNTKVDKIQKGYKEEFDKKARAKEQGITLKELEEKEMVIGVDMPAKKKKFAPKKTAKKDDFVVEIKMKGNDGEILNYDMQKALEESLQTDDKDDKDKAETAPPTKIEAEDTLQMIQQALGGGADPQVPSPRKKKPVTKKKIVKKKEPVDQTQKFFNNYSDNPHLQQIENGYLKHLEVQFAQESRLKAIKKFQILHALKKIQRYWKIKYQVVQERSAVKIQKLARKFIEKMNYFRGKLHQIRLRLMKMRLRKALILYYKNRRIKKAYYRQDILQIGLAQIKSVVKMQGMVKVFLAKRALAWRKKANAIIQAHMVLQTLYFKRYVNKLTRDKETYWIQRYSMGRVESDQIQKYIRTTEKKFEQNWKQYEDSLEKYLLNKSQGDFKDWIIRKDEMGKDYWTNTTTLKSQIEHPGQKIFQTNKRILKNKAQIELASSLEDITERKYVLMETIIGLKDKVSKDVTSMRVESALQSRRERASWRKSLALKNKQKAIY